MKKSLLFAALAVVAMASCSKNEAVDAAAASEEMKTIAFDTFIDRTTKATVSTTSTLQGNGFTVVCYNTGTGTAYADATDVTPIIASADVTYATNAWTYSPAVQWASGYNLSFFAYSPKSTAVTMTAATGSVSTTNVNPSLAVVVPAKIADQVDILAGETLNQAYSDSPSPVDIDFSHILSKIGFTATSGITDSNTATITDVLVAFENPGSVPATDPLTYLGLSSSETYTFGNGTTAASWSANRTAFLISSAEVEGGDPNESVASDAVRAGLVLTATAQNVMADGSYLMIIPQELKSDAAIKVTVKYTVSSDSSTTKTKTAYIKSPITYEAGKAYTYNLIVGNDTIVFSTSIEVSSFTDYTGSQNYDM